MVSFDGIVTEPCAWRIAVDFKQMGKDEVTYLAGKMPDGGNLLEIRGLAGVFVDDAISSGIHEGVAENPQFKIVGSVHGDWAQDVAQKAVAGVLPSLPDIVGVVTQGGDGYGAAQAIKAAGRDMPTIIMGNRQDELAWWKEQKDASGYETMSVSIAPGVSTLAFWVAQQILDGKDVPKDLTVPVPAHRPGQPRGKPRDHREGRRRQRRILPGRRAEGDLRGLDVSRRGDRGGRIPDRRTGRRRKVLRRRPRVGRASTWRWPAANASASSGTTAPASRR